MSIFITHRYRSFLFFFFFNDTATTEIYTLSLHDALPISPVPRITTGSVLSRIHRSNLRVQVAMYVQSRRSEEHTSELQSRLHLVCRLLLEKKKKKKRHIKIKYSTKNTSRTSTGRISTVLV